MFNHTGNLLLQTMLYLAQTDNITFPVDYTASANNLTLEGDSEYESRWQDGRDSAGGAFPPVGAPRFAALFAPSFTKLI